MLHCPRSHEFFEPIPNAIWNGLAAGSRSASLECDVGLGMCIPNAERRREKRPDDGETPRFGGGVEHHKVGVGTADAEEFAYLGDSKPRQLKANRRDRECFSKKW